MKIPVLDTNRKVLAPCSPRRARLLLSTGKAAVFKRFPFTIILKREIEEAVLPNLRLKIDPGSKTTGLAIVNQASGEVVFAAELSHHGQAIKASLDSRRVVRRGRRMRKTRYRQRRFLNRSRLEGWIAPSLNSRIYNITTWSNRLDQVYPISGVVLELVKFDTQLMGNPEISGIEYQQGELQGYEVREYLLEKWQRECAYCLKRNTPLQIEHIIPKSRGGTNKISNLTLACKNCNLKKGARTALEFGFPEIQAQARLSFKDAAAVNTIRFATLNALKLLGFEVETGTGALTKYNRTRRGLQKTHWADAACVGESTPETMLLSDMGVLLVRAMGWGSRQMCSTDKFGFPVGHRTRRKTFMGFKTGDYVEANIPKGKFSGKHVGRVTIRQRKRFTLNGFDVSVNHIQRRHRADGYDYCYKAAGRLAPMPSKTLAMRPLL